MAATPAVVKRLVDELIGAVTGITVETDPDNFQICHDYALNRIKNHTYVHTNPFEVTRRLDGLEERFSVVCKDDLAHALRSRLTELKSHDFKWSSEVLSLLIHLSYRPIDNAKLSDLEVLKPPPSPKPLTWEDILKDDPWGEGDEELWNQVDYGRESDLSSLEDEEMVDVEEEEGDLARVTLRRRKEAEEAEEVAEVRSIDSFTESVDWNVLKPLKGAQYWYVPNKALEKQVDSSLSINLTQSDDLWLVSELHAIRETLFMLNGVHCNLYEVGKRSLTTGKDPTLVWIDTHKLKKKFALRHASRDGMISVLGWFAERGTAINKIREFVRRKEESPARQAFAASLDKALAGLGVLLSGIEGSFVMKGEGQVISLLKLQQSLETPLTPYIHLSRIVTQLTNPVSLTTTTASTTATTSPPPTATSSTTSSNGAFSLHLDLLFNTACLLQSIGDLASFQFLARIFFQCLQTYLRPIREWMESGYLRPNDTTFFVAKVNGGGSGRAEEAVDDVNLGSLWHDQFALIKDEQGNVKAPRFVSKEAANTIFTTGKSVVFLKRLFGGGGAGGGGGAYELPPPPPGKEGLEINWETIFPPGVGVGSEGGGNVAGILELAPFDELFATAFGDWTGRRHHSASARLRDALFEHCGLEKAIDAIGVVYLGSDGAKASMLASTLFERLEKSLNSGSGGDKGKQQGRDRGRSLLKKGRGRSRGRGVEWNDRFVLTEVVQSVFAGEASPVDVKRLSVRKVDVVDADLGVEVDLDHDGDVMVQTPPHPSSSNRAQSRRHQQQHQTLSTKNLLSPTKLLEGVEIEYALPWPLQNILPPHCFSVFKRLYTFLLQLRRAKHVLDAAHILIQILPLPNTNRYSLHPGHEFGRRNNCDRYSNFVLVKLRHRLLWFVNTLLGYVTYHVIFPQRVRLERELRRAGDVDGVVGVVAGWVARLEEMALLGTGLRALKGAVGEVLEVVEGVGGWISKRATEVEEGEVVGGGVLLVEPQTPRKRRDVMDGGGRSRSRRRRRRRRRAAAGEATDEDDDDDFSESDGDDSVLYRDFASDTERSRSRGGSEDAESVLSDVSMVGGAGTSGLAGRRLTGREKEDAEIAELEGRVGELLAFLRGGLRGVSRAGVVPHLEVLAEGLEAGREGGWMG